MNECCDDDQIFISLYTRLGRRLSLMLNGYKKRRIEIFDELLTTNENQIRAQCNALNKSEGGYHEVVPGCDISELPTWSGPAQWRAEQSPGVVQWAVKHPEGPGLFIGLMVRIYTAVCLTASAVVSEKVIIRALHMTCILLCACLRSRSPALTWRS
jgi:hypothetical protein